MGSLASAADRQIGRANGARAISKMRSRPALRVRGRFFSWSARGPARPTLFDVAEHAIRYLTLRRVRQRRSWPWDHAAAPVARRVARGAHLPARHEDASAFHTRVEGPARANRPPVSFLVGIFAIVEGLAGLSGQLVARRPFANIGAHLHRAHLAAFGVHSLNFLQARRAFHRIVREPVAAGGGRRPVDHSRLLEAFALPERHPPRAAASLVAPASCFSPRFPELTLLHQDVGPHPALRLIASASDRHCGQETCDDNHREQGTHPASISPRGACRASIRFLASQCALRPLPVSRSLAIHSMLEEWAGAQPVLLQLSRGARIIRVNRKCQVLSFSDRAAKGVPAEPIS